MTEEQLWNEVLARIPGPFRGRVAVLEKAVIFRSYKAATAKILAIINRRRDGYENDVVFLDRWPLQSVPLRPDSAEEIAHRLTDAAFDAVLASLPLPVVPPLELDDAREYIHCVPTGEEWVALDRFETVLDLKEYVTRVSGFRYRAHLADYLSGGVDRRSGKYDTSVVFEMRCAEVRRKDRTVVIRGYEPMAQIILYGGRYGREGRTVAGADYGVMRDEDLLAPAMSFLRFEGD